MVQTKKHAKAEQFRAQIKSSAQRKAAINELMGKTSYDEVDELRIKILLSKLDLTVGCENEYRKLVVHLATIPSWQSTAVNFYRKWHD